MSFPKYVLKNMPEIFALLQIPEDHYIGVLIGFGWPEIRYARGTQRTLSAERIHRPKIAEDCPAERTARREEYGG